MSDAPDADIDRIDRGIAELESQEKELAALVAECSMNDHYLTDYGAFFYALSRIKQFSARQSSSLARTQLRRPATRRPSLVSLYDVKRFEQERPLIRAEMNGLSWLSHEWVRCLWWIVPVRFYKWSQAKRLLRSNHIIL